MGGDSNTGAFLPPLTPSQSQVLRLKLVYFVAAAFLAWLIQTITVSIVDSREEAEPFLTGGQLSLIIAYVFCSVMFLINHYSAKLPAFFVSWLGLTGHEESARDDERHHHHHRHASDPKSSHEKEKEKDEGDNEDQTARLLHSRHKDSLVEVEESNPASSSSSSTSSSSTSGASLGLWSRFGRCLGAVAPFSGHIVAFGTPILIFMYFVMHPELAMEKTPDFDFFLFAMACFFLASLLTIKKAHTQNILNRDQTEEWKGWMQIAFLAYHYFKVKEVYNTIRVLIACYVWMTGFGHVYFCAQQNKYDVVRVIRMLFRLNFMIFFVCISTDTQYMLYYICAMHTFWFLVAYGTMFVFHQYNRIPGVIFAKIILALVFVAVLYEVPGVANIFFAPLSFLLDYNDDNMHEWLFRVKLDRYVPIWGMLFGYVLPSIQTWLNNLESKGRKAEWAVKLPISFAFLGLTYYWVNEFFLLEKFDYNEVHPFTSFIPLFSYLWFRNLTPTLRTYYLDLFAWWGKVTLESYISQFYLFLANTTKAIVKITPNYPFINFLISSSMLVAASVVLFNSTVFFADKLIPQDAFKTYRNLLTVFTYCLAFYTLSHVLILANV